MLVFDMSYSLHLGTILICHYKHAISSRPATTIPRGMRTYVFSPHAMSYTFRVINRRQKCNNCGMEHIDLAIESNSLFLIWWDFSFSVPLLTYELLYFRNPWASNGDKQDHWVMWRVDATSCSSWGCFWFGKPSKEQNNRLNSWLQPHEWAMIAFLTLRVQLSFVIFRFLRHTFLPFLPFW